MKKYYSTPRKNYGINFKDCYFTSDSHLKHRRILEYQNRPFENIDHHDDALIDGINSTVPRNKFLILGGDFCLPSRNQKIYMPAVKAMFDRIKCKNIFFVPGNHDQPEIAKLTETGHILLYDKILNLKFNKQLIIVCHFPFFSWEKVRNKSIHLYGHTHSNIEEILNKILPNRNSCDIGVDNHYRLYGNFNPFSWEQILENMGNKKEICARLNQGNKPSIEEGTR